MSRLSKIKPMRIRQGQIVECQMTVSFIRVKKTNKVTPLLILRSIAILDSSVLNVSVSKFNIYLSLKNILSVCRPYETKKGRT